MTAGGGADDLLARDRRFVWHPYTQHGLDEDPLPVVAAAGARLHLADGRTLIDAISSWWACLHGHGHPALVAAAERQARSLDHVLFAGATHEPAVALAEELLAVAPPGLARVFYSDDGSTAVEVALKIVLQSWALGGEPERRVFVALEGGYHGDTFGAMAVGDPAPFFEPFRPLLFPVRRVPVAPGAVAAALAALGGAAAGVILEPLVQGAAGMRMHPPAFVQDARAACDAAGVPLIADEVMTGFGRTGRRFACEAAGIAPDVLCLAKGLTGGMLPLAATLVREPLFAAFRAPDRGRAFFHGHTFTANPIACAVARASLELVVRDDVPARLDALGRLLEEGVADLRGTAGVQDVRRTGGIVAVELAPADGTGGYLADLGAAVRAEAAAHGVLLRPLGPVLYALPPACLSTADVQQVVRALRAAVARARLG